MKRKCQTTMHTNDKGPFHLYQTITEAKHNQPIPKLFDNQPSASAAEVFCETIRPIVSQKNQVIYTQNIPIIVSFSLLLS